jgi:glutaminyl-peptide cyclotransferase
MRKILFFVLSCLTVLFVLTACDNAPALEHLMPEIVSVYPHDPDAFTQGLLLHNGLLYESTGLRGESTLRIVEPLSGAVLRSIDVSEPYFAEGLALVDDYLIQLTWQEETAFVYDVNTLEMYAAFSYTGEGWGLCYDGEQLYLSDGSATLSVRNPETFAEIARIDVTLAGEPVTQLNELECVGDDVYANVWHTELIMRIDKTSGIVTAVVDTTNLLTPEQRATLNSSATLNGIAYDEATGNFFITGKLWAWMFEVRFVPQNP